MKLFASFQAQSLLQNKNIQWTLKLLMGLILFGFVLCLLIILFHNPMRNTAQEKAEQQQTLIALNRLETSVNQLTIQMSHVDQNKGEEVAAINTHLNSIEQAINKLDTTSSLQQLETILTQSQDEVVDKITELQQQIQHLKKQLIPPAYLPPSKLPFKVISIDIWNGIPEATIQLHHATDLMAQNDSRSGWTLITLSFDPAYVVFKNTHDQLIKVELNA